MVPGYDPIKVEKRWLEAHEVPDSAELFPLVPEKDQQGQETGGLTYKFPPQPNPEMEIQKADMQRRTLEGQSRAETDMLLAQSKVNVDEASIIKLMADAAVAADTPELERLKLLIKDQESIRKSLVEIKKVESGNQKADS